VQKGGHGIPSNIIQRRFRKGVWNLLNLYLPLADTVAIYDNSDLKRVLAARREAGGGLEIHDAARWARIEELSQ
jgi:predicted ABC-type ATPase